MASRLAPGSVIADEERAGPQCLVGVTLDAIEPRLRACPRIREKGERLGRRPGLGRDDHERPDRVEVVERGRHERGVGRVEDAQLEVPLLAAERPMEDVRREAAAAHAGHDRCGEPFVHDAVAEAFEAGDPLGELGRGIEPAEPIADGRLDGRVHRPEARIAREQPVHPVLDAGTLDGLGVRRGQIAEGEAWGGGLGRDGLGHRGLRRIGSRS